ncbi:hypothetical protein CRG98_039934 [Punica granatum]|uniref:CCT domain-containing protein n=1 Tax=Punica granatum TaxID=22663 RepID=A0A2I0I6S2_PUNGR|nr:hypothetical protein CRG98_039934 [Punica granatum]
MKSSSTSTWTSNNSSSPSSTLSESSNSPVFVCTRKPRTQRKRPNQKYNEAAALLSTAYPNIFSSENLWSPPKLSSNQEDIFFDESSEPLLPFQVGDKSEFLLHHDPIQENERPSSQTEPKPSPLSEKPCQSHGEIEIQSNPMELFQGHQEDFDAESILDEEIEEGIIDTIMGDLRVDGANDFIGEPNSMGLGSDIGGEFNFGFGRGMEANAMRNVNGMNNWWDFPFPTVDVFEISPRFSKSALPNSANKKKKKKNAVKPTKPKPKEEPKSASESVEANPNTSEPPDTLEPNPKQKLELLLKLNYDGILREWSGQGSPFSDESMGLEMQGVDVPTRLAQIDLFPEAGALREASVQRYKEKRRTRLFSKKIRYEVRKVNADQRPRMKGRFVRQQNSSSNRKR